MAPDAFEFLQDMLRLSLDDIWLISVKTVADSFYS